MKCASCLTAQLHRLSLTVVFSFLGIFSVIGCQISCNSNVQISLDQSGEVLLTPSLFLSNALDCNGPFVVSVTANASTITDNTLRCAQVGQNIIAQVTDSETQVSCWSTISVTDYNPPKFVNCMDIFVPCYTTDSIDDLSTVTAQDNCDPNPNVQFIDNETTFSCDTYSKIITRTWNATDIDGYQATPCIQRIYFEAVTLDEIDIPADFTFNNCANPNITPDSTGQPIVDGNSITGAHCGLLIQHEDQSFPSCGNSFKIFRNWTIYDWCGNPPLTGTQVIEIIDDTPPVIECPTDTIVFNSNSPYNCTGDVSALNLDITDDCGTTSVVYDWSFNNNTTNVPIGIYIINAIATDECMNVSECLFHIEVKDTQAPIAICDTDFTISIGQNGNTFITAEGFDNGSVDNCGIVDKMISIDGNFEPTLELTCDNIGNPLEVTLMVTDECGNSSMCSSNVNTSDNILPTITCPADITIFCFEDPNDLSLTGNATAADNCVDYTPLFLDSGELSTCNTGSILRTWRISENGIEITCDQTITIEGEVPTIVFPDDVTVSCGADAGEPIVDFNCPGFFIGSNDEVLNDQGCLIITRKIWKVFNSCTDEIFEQTQLVTEIDDTPPTFTTPAQNVSIECETVDTNTPLQEWLNNNGNAIAIDSCNAFTWTNTFVSSQVGCGGTESSTYTFIATDECGNSASTTATFSIVDNTPPQFLIPPPDTTFSCNVKDLTLLDEYFGSGAASTFSDNCSGVEVSFNADDNDTDFCDSYPVTILLTDECGNTNTATFQLTIIDEEAPIIGEEAKDLNLNCDADIDSEIAAWLAINGTATAVDRCADVIWTNNYNPASLICGGAGNPVTFFANDQCGNTTPTTASIFIIDDEAPQFISSPQDITIFCSANTDAEINAYLSNGNGAIFSDNCGTPTLLGQLDNDLGDGCGSTGVTFILTDDCNNSILSNTTLTIDDTTPPTITQNPQDLLIDCAQTDIETSIQAWLNVNGNAIAEDACGTIIWTNDYDGFRPNCDGVSEALVTFTATDLCNNSIDVIGTFRINDMTGPNITTAASNLVINCEETDNDNTLQNWLQNNGGAIATDPCGSVIWSNNFDAFESDCGSTSVTFTATDECGNIESTNATFSIEDNTAPQFLIPPPDTTFSCNVKDLTLLNDYFTSGAASTFEDNCFDVQVTFSVDDEGANFCDTYPVTIMLTDACGNTNAATFQLTIIDEEAPILGEEAKDLNLDCEADINAEINAWLAINGTATAVDRCVDVTWTNNYDPATLVCGGDGTTVTFVASDQCGNSISTSANIFILDDEAPEFQTLPQDITIECSANIDTDIINYQNNGNGAVFSDNCGTPLLFGELDEELGEGCTSTTVTFTLTDNCNNSISASTILTIDDTTPPTITQAPQELFIECDPDDIRTAILEWISNNGNAIAEDACGVVTWTNNYEGSIPTCDGISEEEVIFTATDICGNSTPVVGVFRVEDTAPPTISFEANDAVVECDGLGNEDDLQNWLQSNGGAAADDICGPVIWTNDFEAIQTSCGSTGVTEVTFTATDLCGNSSSSTGTFTIIDTTPPEFLAAPMDFVTECDGSGNMFEFEVWSTNFGGGFATDNCGTVNTSFDLTSTELNCETGESVTLTVLFIAVDECGNLNSAFANFIIFDTTEPVVTCPQDIQDFDLDTNCNNDITIPDAVAGDFCSDEFIYSYDVDLDQDGTLDIIGATGQNASGNYPVGRHFVIYSAEDECGNIGTCQQVIDIVDIVSPQIPCLGNAIFLDENGEFDLLGDAIATSTDNCSEVQVTTSIDILTCDFAGQSVELTIEVLDSYGNLTTCIKTSTIIDAEGVCPGPQGEMALIGGSLYREDFAEVENASVVLSDGMSSSMFTDNNGEYIFNVNMGNNYTITPYKNDDPTNGVTTIDLITLQQHILGSIPIESPYQLIAADANNSGSISTLDLVEIQQLILDIIPEFTNNTSWRFVDESYVFPSPANPFASYFPETASFNNLNGVSQNNDFIAIKIGDVNGSAITGNAAVNVDNRSASPTYLYTKNEVVEKEEVINLPIAFIEQQNISGYQFQVVFDTDVFEFVEISNLQLPNLTMDNFGLNQVDRGIITTNWINAYQHIIPASESVFTIQLRAKIAANLKDLITVNPLNTYNEIYTTNEDGALFGAPLHLTFKENTAIPNTGKDQVFLYQNAPNPFEDRTTILFNLPQLTKSTVSIYDAAGRLIWQVSKEFPAGENQVTIEGRDLGLEGVYIYTLDTEYGREVKKMILMKR